MPHENVLESEMSIAEVMNKWPEMVPVFVSAGMICVGCALAIFCDMLYVRDIYGLKVVEVLSNRGRQKGEDPK